MKPTDFRAGLAKRVTFKNPVRETPMFYGFVKTVTLAKSTELWSKTAPGERFRLPSKVSKYRGLRGEVPQQLASTWAPHLWREAWQRGVGGAIAIRTHDTIFRASIRLPIDSNLLGNR
jgi:hypothetical protein